MTHPFRFGLQLHSPIADLTWLDSARYAETQGFSSLLIPDHFHHQYGPLSALGAAAAVTTRLKIGALVFGNDYRHPVTLAKEMATLDQISQGRCEFGIGAGWLRDDYEQSGMTYDPPGTRIDRLLESLEIIKGCWGSEAFDFVGEHYNVSGYEGQPKPWTQKGPPIIIGGGGPRMLGLAAQHADIVGVTANLRSGEVGDDAIADSMAAAYDQKISRIRECAGSRINDLELSSLTLVTAFTNARQATLNAVADMFGVPAAEIAESPAALVGSVAQIVETLQQRRERWGFNYVVVQQDGGQGMKRFPEVIARLAGT
ncbi:MAG: TIGR03621 family F420-dependent LLM class oxidoreductase [Acidimicrobiia bacterium]|nr:TIGR03621 family F420-dependent LLM class oxidoreductase [Acidimicrobiia bacterium]MCY4457274.1 TIGR03621 family F420-dependent LLM class oxidoreductase [Acidimicrobiaceae bacterium]